LTDEQESKTIQLLKILQCPNDGSHLDSSLRCPQGHQFLDNSVFIDFLGEYRETKMGPLERLGSFYEDVWAPLGFLLSSGRTYSWMLRKSSFSSANTVLDIGTGTGIAFDFLKCDLCIGLDLSKELLQIAKRRRPGLKLLRADAQNIPLNDSTVEGVVFNLALHLVPNKEKAIYEVRRILRGGGKFSLTVLVANKGIGKVLGKVFKVTPLPSEYYVELVKSNGFRVVERDLNGGWLTLLSVKDNQ